MKQFWVVILFISLATSGFAGQPFVGIEGGASIDKIKGKSHYFIGTVGAFAGYELDLGKVYFTPKLSLGYEQISDKGFLLPMSRAELGSYFTDYDRYFYTSLSATLGVNIIKGLSVYTTPTLKYFTPDFLNKNWVLYWGFGLGYRFSRFKVFCAYNQQVTKAYWDRLNPITGGLQIYF